MKRRRVTRRLILLAVLLIVGLGGWIWWVSNRNQTTLTAVARFPGDELGDLSVSGVLTIIRDEGINVYDWDGRLRDQIPAIGVPGYRLPPDYAWFSSETFNDSWFPADAGAYAKYSVPYRQVSTNVTLARFSPDGQIIGCLAFQPRQLEVLVRRDGQTRWRRVFPVTAAGLITGSKHLDLLVDNDGRVFLYLPQPSSIANEGQMSASPRQPPPTAIMAITERTVQTANLQRPFQALVANYQRSLMGQQSAPAITRTGQHSPDGQYTLTIQRIKDSFDIRARRWYNEWLSGRKRLVITKGPDTVLASYTAHTWVNDDHEAIILPFRDGEFQYYGAVFFSPDGSRLLFQGDFVDWSNEWAIYRY